MQTKSLMILLSINIISLPPRKLPFPNLGNYTSESASAPSASNATSLAGSSPPSTIIKFPRQFVETGQDFPPSERVYSGSVN